MEHNSGRGSHQTLTVQNLSYQVDEKHLIWWQRLAGFQFSFKKQNSSKKHIIKDVNLAVSSGHMLAILGCSGSGKTSLLDAISCQISNGNVTGKVHIDNEITTPEVIKENCAYVRQNDRLLPHLTVRETLMFVAQLKLPKTWPGEKIKSRVEEVIAELGLRHVSESKVGGVDVRGISGGERRRVSIAIQLLLDPGILFLDEPTSGLDSFTAHHLMETLSKLAANGRIVILTIHQPRSDIFELFDQILLLSQGTVVFNGKANQMVDYFTKIGYPCPELTNPCDFYVDLTTVDMKTEETELLTQERVHNLVNLYNQHISNESNAKQSSHGEIEMTTLPGTSKGKINYAFENETNSTSSIAVDIPQPAFTSDQNDFMHDNCHKDGIKRNKEHVSMAGQFKILFMRAVTNNLEDYNFLGVQALEAIFMSLMIGLVFYGLKMDQISVRDRFGLLYIIGALYPYMVILDVIGQYHKERNILYFEVLDGLYKITPYFLSKLLSEIPEHTIFVVLYATPVYFLTNLQYRADLFFIYFSIVFITVYCSRCLALFAAAMMPTYQISVLFAQSIFTMMLMSCGFIFNLENIFVGVQWTSYISYLKWGNQGLCNTEFPGLNFTCEIPSKDACIWTGEQALAVYSLDSGDVPVCAAAILAECVVFLIGFYLCLQYVSQKPHEQ